MLEPRITAHPLSNVRADLRLPSTSIPIWPRYTYIPGRHVSRLIVAVATLWSYIAFV